MCWGGAGCTYPPPPEQPNPRQWVFPLSDRCFIILLLICGGGLPPTLVPDPPQTRRAAAHLGFSFPPSHPVIPINEFSLGRVSFTFGGAGSTRLGCELRGSTAWAHPQVGDGRAHVPAWETVFLEGCGSLDSGQGCGGRSQKEIRQHPSSHPCPLSFPTVSGQDCLQPSVNVPLVDKPRCPP